MQGQFSRKRERRVVRNTVATLNLTSLVDIFTIILIFLLMNYSVETSVLVPTQKLKLPASTSRKKPKEKLIVQVSTDDIIVEGKTVANVTDALNTDGPLIDTLFEALNHNTKKTEFIARNNDSVKFTGEVMIQGDRNIPFVLLKKIMYSCGQAGYGNISLAVVSNE